VPSMVGNPAVAPLTPLERPGVSDVPFIGRNDANCPVKRRRSAAVPESGCRLRLAALLLRSGTNTKQGPRADQRGGHFDCVHGGWRVQQPEATIAGGFVRTTPPICSRSRIRPIISRPSHEQEDPTRAGTVPGLQGGAMAVRHRSSGPAREITGGSSAEDDSVGRLAPGLSDSVRTSLLSTFS
jgi:hypothetical protein